VGAVKQWQDVWGQTPPLGKGDAALSRCIPLACAAYIRVEPSKRIVVQSLALIPGEDFFCRDVSSAITHMHNFDRQFFTSRTTLFWRFVYSSSFSV